VRLEEDHRKCVVVIGTGDVGAQANIEPWGTGFIVAWQYPQLTYLVTAAHVITNDDKLDVPFDVRFNHRKGGAKNLHIDEPNWVLPADDTVDIAVHRLPLPKWAEVAFVQSHPTVLQDRRFKSKNIGAGNRTYTVGLFKFLKGDQRNQPFVYTGHIGLIPEDQRIPVDPWLPVHNKKRVGVEAYLVEGEPLDGASGSPVFVRRTVGPVNIPPSQKLKGYIEGSIWLLGILSDVFTAKPGEDYEIFSGQKNVMLPRGVNVVVPSMKIAEIFDEPILKAEREAFVESMQAAQTPLWCSAPD
jgi:hypothetical protein